MLLPHIQRKLLEPRSFWHRYSSDSESGARAVWERPAPHFGHVP